MSTTEEPTPAPEPEEVPPAPEPEEEPNESLADDGTPGAVAPEAVEDAEMEAADSPGDA
jgi:hypothetical protein